MVIISMFSTLLGCPFSGHFAREQVLEIFCLHFPCFQGAALFSSVIYGQKSKNPEKSPACHSLRLSSLAGLLSSVSFKVLCVFYI